LSAAPNATGLTLIELLVVLAIIGLLIALVIHAVQATREAARRAACSNNLAQIGIALQTYHGTHQVLPSGWIAVDPGTGRPYAIGEPGWGWASMILPFVEQGNVAKDLIHFSRPIASPENDLARVVEISTFRCPSGPGPDLFDLAAAGSPTQVLTRLATGNYVGVFGSGGVEHCATLNVGTECRGDGVFYHLSRTRLDDVRDGLSHTLFVAEHSSRSIISTWVGAVSGSKKAAQRIVGTPSTFSSGHPGGMNCLLGDGAVRFVSGKVDTALVTRSRRDQPTEAR